MLERAAMPVSAATSGPVVSIPLSVWNQMFQSMAPQKSQAETFSPGAPLQPIPGITPAAGPRQWSYPVGFNLAGNDRTLQRDYIPAFQQLRLLAQTYSAVGTAERIWCDLIPRMDMQVTLTDELKAAGKDDKDYTRERLGYLNFFEKPDGQDDYHEWLRKAIVDQTQIDALVMFKRRTRGGKLQGLDILDGSDIKPLLDERGRVPVPPYAAFQQYSYGTPGQAYTTEDMIYYRESPRTFSPYGFSRVERIITIVNIALRKQQKDLLRYTDGNIPAGIMEVPDTSGWTPDQIETFEQMWNSLLAGNAQQQVRIKFTQPGMKYSPFDQPEAQLHLTEFDMFLLNICAGVYGVSMADLAMTGDIHKSADEGQQNMLYRRTIEPLAIAYGRIFTKILREDIGDPRFVVKFGGYDEKEDVGQQVSAFAQGIQNAMISPADAAAKLGWPDIPKTGPLFITKGGITPLASFEIGSASRQTSDDAQLAGFQLAAQGQPEAKGNPGKQDQVAGGKEPPKDGQDTASPAPGQKEDEESPVSRVAEMIQKADEILAIIRAQNVTPPWPKEEDIEQRTQQDPEELPGNRTPEGTSLQSDAHPRAAGVSEISHPHDGSEQAARSADYRRWRERAIADVKAGRAQRPFESTLISNDTYTYLFQELARCECPDDVRAAFERAKNRERDASFFVTAVGSGGNPHPSRSDWKLRW
jgi:hypothetical protein